MSDRTVWGALPAPQLEALPSRVRPGWGVPRPAQGPSRRAVGPRRCVSKHLAAIFGNVLFTSVVHSLARATQRTRVPRPAQGPSGSPRGSPAPGLKINLAASSGTCCRFVLSTRPRPPLDALGLTSSQASLARGRSPTTYKLVGMGQKRSQRLAVDRERGAPISACTSKAEVDDRTAVS